MFIVTKYSQNITYISKSMCKIQCLDSNFVDKIYFESVFIICFYDSSKCYHNYKLNYHNCTKHIHNLKGYYHNKAFNVKSNTANLLQIKKCVWFDMSNFEIWWKISPNVSITQSISRLSPEYLQTISRLLNYQNFNIKKVVGRILKHILWSNILAYFPGAENMNVQVFWYHIPIH